MIDTHAHLIETEEFEYPWLESVPDLSGTWHYPRWSVEARPAGIEHGIFMEVDAADTDREAEAAYYCSLAEDPSSIITAVIAACRPERDDFAGQLEALEHPKLVGVRRVFHVAPDGTLENPKVVENLKLVGQRDLTFDLCLRPDQLETALRVIDACPHTQFILDHCGNPPIGKPRFPDWKTNIRALALRPNLVCKISGLVNHIPEGKDPVKTLTPILEWVARKFGTHRIMFGSDWPVSTLAGFELGDWVNLLKALTDEWSESERKDLFRNNAEKTYGLN